jgi:hypothetical protein
LCSHADCCFHVTAALAQQSILSSEPFLNYLKYLAYFRDAKYAKFIHYPQALHHLQLVTESEAFREAVKTDEMVAELARAQVEHWKSWRELREGLPVATTSIAPAAYEAPSTSV